MFKKLVSIQFSINWLRWIIYAAFLLIGAYVLLPKWRNSLVYVTAVLGGIGILISAFNEIEARYEAIRHSTVHRALDFVRDWNAPAFYNAKNAGREVLRHFRTNGCADDEYLTTRLQSLLDILNFFEMMSLAIQINQADDLTAKRFFRGIVVEHWQVAEQWIKRRRAEKNNPRLFIELESLAKQWSA